MPNDVLMDTNFTELGELKRGKVRDIYDLGDALLIVATDRISAYDSILASGIPDKGRVLTGLSEFWFDFMKDITKNHLITSCVMDMDRGVEKYADDLAGRSMLVHKAKVFPVECVVRGYLAGSGWREYKETGCVCGVKLRDGLQQSSKLDEPIFTPATKAESGHDENISVGEACKIIGKDAAEQLRDRSIEIYCKAAEYAKSKGIIVCDTKFEWGEIDGEIALIDEVLTPDSSRLWPSEHYKPGGPQPSFDKQFVRDYLDQSGWDHNPPAPALPADIAEQTSQKYKDAYEKLTGKAFVVSV